MAVIKKTIQTAHVEQKAWKQELFRFLRNYRATPHSTTGVSPAEALFGRQIKTTLPSLKIDASDDAQPTPPLHVKIRINDAERKEKMKTTADATRRARHSNIQVGDTVLARQPPQNKLTPHYSPVPMMVTACKGTMVTAQSNSTQVTRNSSFFKKIPPSLDHVPETLLPGEEDDEENAIPGTSAPAATDGDQTPANQPGVQSAGPPPDNPGLQPSRPRPGSPQHPNSDPPGSPRRSQRQLRPPLYLQHYQK